MYGFSHAAQACGSALRKPFRSCFAEAGRGSSVCTHLSLALKSRKSFRGTKRVSTYHERVVAQATPAAAQACGSPSHKRVASV